MGPSPQGRQHIWDAAGPLPRSRKTLKNNYIEAVAEGFPYLPNSGLLSCLKKPNLSHREYTACAELEMTRPAVGLAWASLRRLVSRFWRAKIK